MTIKATTKALLGTAVSFALLGSAGIAYAADLDNLSDDDLLSRIERLEKIIGPGDNYAVRSGGDKIRVEISGQFHRSIIGFSDGEETNVVVADPTQLSSRVRWKVSGKLNDDVSVSGLFEADIDLGTNGGFSQNVLNLQGGNDPTFTLRHSAFTLKSKTVGGITLGTTNVANNGSTENDFSGTGHVQYFSQADVGANIILRNNGILSANTVGNFIGGDFDGFNRDDVIRYDSPSFAGFSVAASYTNGGQYAVAGSYKNKDIAGFGIGATVAYGEFTNQLVGGAISPDDNNRLSGSIAAIHLGTGLNAAFGFAFDGSGTSNSINAISPLGLASSGASQLYGKLGWRGDLVELGKTSFAGDIAFIRDVGVEGTSARQFSLFVNQTIDAISTDLYLGWRNINITDTAGVTAPDFATVNQIYAGGRVSF